MSKFLDIPRMTPPSVSPCEVLRTLSVWNTWRNKVGGYGQSQSSSSQLLFVFSLLHAWYSVTEWQLCKTKALWKYLRLKCRVLRLLCRVVMNLWDRGWLISLDQHSSKRYRETVLRCASSSHPKVSVRCSDIYRRCLWMTSPSLIHKQCDTYTHIN